MDNTEFIEEYFVWARQATTDASAAVLDFALITNQTDGIVSFASSRDLNQAVQVADRQLVYHHSYPEGIFTRLEHFRVTCEYYFSDRLKDLGGPYGPSQIPTGPMQPFAVDQYDKINLILYARGDSEIYLHIDLLTWQSSFEISMNVVDDMLFGVGSPIGNNVPNATYLLSLYNKAVVSV